MIPRAILSNCPTDPPPRERNLGYGDHQADSVRECTARFVVDGRGGDGCFDEVSSPGTPLRLTGRGEVYVVGDSVAILPRMAKITLPGFRCERCGHEWAPRDTSKDPTVCPKCKSPYWNKPRQDKRKPPRKKA